MSAEDEAQIPASVAANHVAGHVGTVRIQCPECGELMPATVSAAIENPEGSDVGDATLVCTPDMTDIHAHMWTHSDL
jgi:hypothetical protein